MQQDSGACIRLSDAGNRTVSYVCTLCGSYAAYGPDASGDSVRALFYGALAHQETHDHD